MNQPYDPKRHDHESMEYQYENQEGNHTQYQGHPMRQSINQDQQGLQELPPRSSRHRTPWYNGRWLIALAVIFGVVIIGWALSGLTQEVAGVNDSIQAQTDVLQEQNGILAGIGTELRALSDAIRDGVNRIIDTIRNTASSFTNVG